MTGLPSLAGSKNLHQCQLIRHKMEHFINQLQHYFLFEVIECSWVELAQFVHNFSGDLDSLIAAHNKYLNIIMLKGFLVSQNNVFIKIELIDN